MNFLEKLLKRQKEQRATLMEALVNAETVEERTSINETIAQLDADIADTEAEIRNSEGQEPNARSFNPMATYGLRGNEMNDDGDPTNSIEYRSAFMKHVLTGAPMPAEARADANTTTTDVPAVIPQILVEDIISKLENEGKIYALVNKTSYKSGFRIPKGNFNIVASIVGEGQGSDRQKQTLNAYVTFTNFKLRCEISMSMEVGTMALAIFEQRFVAEVTKAMARKIDELIIKGTGTDQPKGILAETPEEGQALKVDKLSYQTLVDAEAAIPEEYENDVVWCMSKKTFMQFIGMTDANGQPIARVNYGIAGKPERTLLGRDVVTTKHVDTFSDALAEEKVFAFLYDFSKYTWNTLYDLGIQRKQDWETEDLLTKAVMSVDGKCVDTYSLVTLAKAKATTPPVESASAKAAAK